MVVGSSPAWPAIIRNMKKSKNNKTNIENHQDFIIFLEKRVQSKNYKANVSKEEYDKTVAKLKKARLKLKLGLIK